MSLLASYSPEFPCLIKGAARYAPVLAGEYMAEKGRKQDTSHGRDS